MEPPLLFFSSYFLLVCFPAVTNFSTPYLSLNQSIKKSISLRWPHSKKADFQVGCRKKALLTNKSSMVFTKVTKFQRIVNQ